MIELKVVPDWFYGEGWVSESEAIVLEEYLSQDFDDRNEYETIKHANHNFMTYSSIHSKNDNDVNWKKYSEIFEPYIDEFLQSLTTETTSYETSTYVNFCDPGQFIAPHIDGGDFMLLYCPINYGEELVETNYILSSNWLSVSEGYDKVVVGNGGINDNFPLIHEKGKFYIVPSRITHWVSTQSLTQLRVTIMTCVKLDRQ